MTNKNDARIGMIGHMAPRGDTPPHFIIVWVGEEEIGAIFPYMCRTEDNISFGPDSTRDKPMITDSYNVVKLRLGDSQLYTGVSEQIDVV